MTRPSHTTLVEVASMVRAHLDVEAELGGAGLVRASITLVARDPRHDAPPWRPPAASPVTVPSRAGAATGRAVAAPGADATNPTSAEITTDDKRSRLALLAEDATTCTRCVLHEDRNRMVFARGSPDADIAFVGEGPGADEDQQGLPFVGRAGQLLDKMITAMGYGREEVYVCNVVKCRPPDNRTPRPEEAEACSRYLVPQLQTVAPKLIVALGRCAAENLGVAEATGSWRGRWGEWKGIPVMPTYHPAFLLRTPEQKRTVWEDLQKAMTRLGRTPPARTR